MCVYLCVLSVCIHIYSIISPAELRSELDIVPGPLSHAIAFNSCDNLLKIDIIIFIAFIKAEIAYIYRELSKCQTPF